MKWEKIDFSKFNRKKLFQSKLLLFIGAIIATAVICGIISLVIDKTSKKEAKLKEKPTEIKIRPTKEVMTTQGLWMNSIESKLKKTATTQEENIEKIKAQLEDMRNKKPDATGVDGLNKRVNNLTRELSDIKSKKSLKIKEVPNTGSGKISQFTLGLDNPKNSESYKPLKTADNYIPAGSFARAVLLSGVDAATSLNASGDPDPMLIRIVDHGTLPRKFKSDLKDCHIIAAVYGDLSSERAKARLEKLSCTEIATGEIIETAIAGYITGEDGRAGIRGEVVSTEGKLLGNSMVAGLLGGLANNFNANSGSQPMALFADKLDNSRRNNLKERFTNSLSSGATSSMDRLSKYYIERAEALQPIVQVGAGRKVDVIFTEGVFFGTSEIKKAIAKKRDENIKNKYSNANINDNTFIRRQNSLINPIN